MGKSALAVAELALTPFTTFDPNGVLLVSGEGVGNANPMTISWGMFGIMWGKPIVMVMVRPTRYTYSLINRLPDFTVNWMHGEWRDALLVCGSVSGNDTDKFAATGLRPIPATSIQSPAIADSLLTLECRTVYRDDITPEKFLDQSLLDMYPARDYHTLFFGEVIAAMGVEQFRQCPPTG